MFGLGASELLIILILVLVLFGATKIPALARSLGKGVSEFRKARSESLNGPAGETAYAVGEPACPSCRQEVGRDALFCSRCGQGLKAAGAGCPQCRTALKPQDKYCPKCGMRVP
ncbi:MAG: twin-arginine translocase TatA/TatE family subunit [Bacteroidota bacterium]